MNRGQIKAVFKEAGVQLGKGAIDQIEYELNQVVKRMANRGSEGNLKRLTPEIFYIARGKLMD